MLDKPNTPEDIDGYKFKKPFRSDKIAKFAGAVAATVMAVRT